MLFTGNFLFLPHLHLNVKHACKLSELMSKLLLATAVRGYPGQTKCVSQGPTLPAKG